jgi:transcriptional antiterminator RfaH
MGFALGGAAAGTPLRLDHAAPAHLLSLRKDDMPILPPEPCCYPDDLFQGPSPSMANDDRWWVLHTRPRSEKSLARVAVREAVSFFLPVYVHRWRNKGRLFKSTLPLFPGYLFVHTTDVARVKLQDTGWVANVLPVSDQARLQADLARVHGLMTAGVSMSPEPHLPAGTRVRITAGPFRGFEGTVRRRGKRFRLVLEVWFVHQGVSVEVEPWMVTILPTEDRGPHPRGP